MIKCSIKKKNLTYILSSLSSTVLLNFCTIKINSSNNISVDYLQTCVFFICLNKYKFMLHYLKKIKNYTQSSNHSFPFKSKLMVIFSLLERSLFFVLPFTAQVGEHKPIRDMQKDIYLQKKKKHISLKFIP